MIRGQGFDLFLKKKYDIIKWKVGVLAQLVRVLRWQRRGQEFESLILHQKNRVKIESFEKS